MAVYDTNHPQASELEVWYQPFVGGHLHKLAGVVSCNTETGEVEMLMPKYASSSTKTSFMVSQGETVKTKICINFELRNKVTGEVLSPLTR